MTSSTSVIVLDNGGATIKLGIGCDHNPTTISPNCTARTTTSKKTPHPHLRRNHHRRPHLPDPPSSPPRPLSPHQPQPPTRHLVPPLNRPPSRPPTPRQSHREKSKASFSIMTSSSSSSIRGEGA
ncbi:hypothetical protein vseg_016323 [Gypsophila vaccaria]